jgi:hypothetical protein
MVNFRIHAGSRSKFVLVCQAAGNDVIPIARKAYGVDLVHLVSWIAPIAILCFHRSLIVNQALCSVKFSYIPGGQMLVLSPFAVGLYRVNLLRFSFSSF